MKYSDSAVDRGFAIIPDLFRDQEITTLLGKIEQRDLPRSRAGVRHALRCPEISEFARDPRLVKVASEILGGSAFPYRATLFDKSPGANWLVVWHQDTALPVCERRNRAGWGPWSVKDGVTYAHAPAEALRKIVALRVHLDGSMDQNGPLRVLPGTHDLGVLTDDQIEQLAARIAPIDCTSNRGGVVAMRPLLVHSSSKSQVSLPRRVLHVEYATDKKIAEDLELAIA